jgi:hypothetical protein
VQSAAEVFASVISWCNFGLVHPVPTVVWPTQQCSEHMFEYSVFTLGFITLQWEWLQLLLCNDQHGVALPKCNGTTVSCNITKLSEHDASIAASVIVRQLSC